MGQHTIVVGGVCLHILLLWVPTLLSHSWDRGQLVWSHQQALATNCQECSIGQFCTEFDTVFWLSKAGACAQCRGGPIQRMWAQQSISNHKSFRTDGQCNVGGTPPLTWGWSTFAPLEGGGLSCFPIDAYSHSFVGVSGINFAHGVWWLWKKNCNSSSSWRTWDAPHIPKLLWH